jgi:hypothetical protein
VDGRKRIRRAERTAGAEAIGQRGSSRMSRDQLAFFRGVRESDAEAECDDEEAWLHEFFVSQKANESPA